MIAAESSTSIARPAAEVFEFVSDVRNDPRWHTDILEAHLTGEGPIGQGSIFVVKFKPFMGHSEGTLSVAKYEPPRRLELQGQIGKMAPTLTPSVDPQGDGSRFTRRVEMELPGIMRLMAPFMKGTFRKQNAGFVENLKKVLGWSPSDPSPRSIPTSTAPSVRSSSLRSPRPSPRRGSRGCSGPARSA